MTTREESLASIALSSLVEHGRLLGLRAAGEIFYDPNPSTLYVAQLEVQDLSGFRHGPHTYTQLFVSRDAALKAGAQNVKDRYLKEGSEDWGIYVPMFALYNEGKYEELLEYCGSHFMFVQRVTIVPVRS